MYTKEFERFTKLIDQAGKEWMDDIEKNFKETIEKLRIKFDTESGIIF